MKQYTIRSKDLKILYSGRTPNFKTCIEQAVQENIDISGAALSHKNLTRIQIDSARLHHADLSFSNLSLANMTECDLRGASMVAADLTGACLAESDLRGCDFRGAILAGADITECDISGAVFGGFSCFHLDFGTARRMADCTYQAHDGTRHAMSRPPVVIRGTGYSPVVFLDAVMVTTDYVLDLASVPLGHRHRKALSSS